MTQHAGDLLATTVALLRETAPTLSGEGRYVALLTANAVAIARREGQAAARLAASAQNLGTTAATIRSGLHDDDAALYERLLADAALRAWVTDPAAPNAAERAAFLADLPR